MMRLIKNNLKETGLGVENKFARNMKKVTHHTKNANAIKLVG